MFADFDSQSVCALAPPLTHAPSQNRHYGVMSLTEYEHNREFAGRNWNAGEIIELVLRRPDHSLYVPPSCDVRTPVVRLTPRLHSPRSAPYLFVLSVMCHELAHIEQMNHSPEFRRVSWLMIGQNTE